MLKFHFKSKESLNRWLVTEVKESYYYSEPAPMEGIINTGSGFIVADYPCRKQFLQDKRITRVSYEDSFREEYQLYVPFENKKVEFSRFNHEPTYMRFFSKCLIQRKEAGEIKFKIGTSGGLKIWINGEEAHSFLPYNRNHMTYEEVMLPFQQGENEIVIYCDDLAERDINYYFEMIPYEDIEVEIPLKLDQEEMEEIEAMLSEMHFSKDCYDSEDVKLLFGKVAKKDLEIEFSFESGDPVNRNRHLKGTALLKQGRDEIILFNTAEYPIGFYKIFLTVDLGVARLTRMLTMENYNRMKAPELKSIDERKSYALKHIADHGDDTLDKTLAILLTKGFTTQAEENFENEIVMIERNHDCADFSLFTLIYMYKNCRDLLSPSAHKRIKAALLNFRYWIDEPGNDCMWYFSENHALCLHGGEFLAGEIFRKDVFRGTMTGEEHFNKGKERLVEWFEDFFRYGLGEWNSVTYIPIDLIGFFGLYILAEDEEIKALAKKALDYVFVILAENFHAGITSASYGRVYEKELKGQLTNECSSLNWIIFGEGYLNNKLRASTLLSISDYVPAKEILEKAFQKSSGKKILTTQGKEEVKLYSYKTEKYSLSSAVDYRRKGLGHQESIMHLNIAGSPKSQLWVSHPGEEVPSGEGRPSYWAGNGRLPNLMQLDNILFMDYKVQPEDRVQFTHMYCDTESYENIILDGNRGFLRKNGVNIFIKTKKDMEIIKNGPTRFREIRVNESDNYWLILADDKIGFEEFCKTYSQGEVKEISPDNFLLELPEKQEIGIRFEDNEIWVNGKEYLNQWKKY